jgi:hypothetical protein
MGACVIALGVVMVLGRRGISARNARMSERIAVTDRDPTNHRPDRDEKWSAAGGVLLVVVGLVMVVLGLASA